MTSPPANDDRPSGPIRNPVDAPGVEARWSGRRTVGVLAGLSVLLWALIAGGVYLLVRTLI